MIQAKKTLGQHFLKNDTICKDIVTVSEIQKGDTVIEIGPGLGQLTKHILNKGAVVTAYDIDDRVEAPLQETFHTEIQNKQFIFKHEDISSIDPIHISSPYTLIGNIPYYITGKILRQFLDTHNLPVSITFLIQKEVAERICAIDGKESILSTAVKLRGTPTIPLHVSREHFTPIPKVDSSVIHIVTTPWNFNVPFQDVMNIVRIGFAHPRKKVLGNLKEILFTHQEKVTEICGNKRAEDLKPEEWVAIASCI